MTNINDAIIYTLLEQPFYGALLSSIIRIEDNNIETAGVTVKTNPILYYNPKFIESLTQDKACGVLIHELLHLILLHQFRENNRNHKLWNIACDLAVNQLIDYKYLPEGALTLDIAKKMTNTSFPPRANAEEYYDLLKDKIDTETVQISMNNNGNIDITIKDSNGNEEKHTVQSLKELEEIDKDFTKSLTKNFIESASKIAGNVPYEIESQLKKIYAPPQMNWRMLLRNFLNARGRLKYQFTYKRESRRFPNAPGKRKLVGMKVLVGIDQSGSVSDDDLQIFMNELRAIQKISGSNIYVAPFDTKVSKPIDLRQYTVQNKRTRCGGTCFEPVFELAHKMRIDTVIVFTDGYANIPDEIAPRTLWVITNNGSRPDKGTVVQFNAK